MRTASVVALTTSLRPRSFDSFRTSETPPLGVGCLTRPRLDEARCNVCLRLGGLGSPKRVEEAGFHELSARLREPSTLLHKPQIAQSDQAIDSSCSTHFRVVGLGSKVGADIVVRTALSGGCTERNEEYNDETYAYSFVDCTLGDGRGACGHHLGCGATGHPSRPCACTRAQRHLLGRAGDGRT